MSIAATERAVALVTGANNGIGFEIARQVGSRAGMHVVLGCRDTTPGATKR